MSGVLENSLLSSYTSYRQNSSGYDRNSHENAEAFDHSNGEAGASSGLEDNVDNKQNPPSSTVARKVFNTIAVLLVTVVIVSIGVFMTTLSGAEEDTTRIFDYDGYDTPYDGKTTTTGTKHTTSSSSSSSQPNILFILADDLGHNSMGERISTDLSPRSLFPYFFKD